ncbi:MAG: DNA polymerase I [Ezakiella sp.]|nr:DNA polymerase I [Ezakiella sp.]MDD7471649.1 DNA polymerase I [Bacillota bacterium]
MDIFLVIDGSSLVNRAFYAMHPLTNKKGIQTHAILGFIRMLDRLIDTYEPARLAVLFDAKGENFRKKLYPDYKANRTGFPVELSLQITILAKLLEARGIAVYEEPGIEADDLAGSIATKYKDDYKIYLVTGDRDYFQLVDNNVSVIYTKKGISETVEYTPEIIEEYYGFSANSLIDLKALMGDKSDNIPGVPGIGEKTGIDLIQKYGNLDGVYDNIDEISGKSRKEKLIENKEMAYLSYELGKIKRDVEVPEDDFFKPAKPAEETLNKIYSELEFKDYMSHSAQKNQLIDVEVEEIKFKDLKDLDVKGKTISAKLFFDKSYHDSDILAFAYFDGEKAFIVKDVNDLKIVREFLERADKIIGFNIKEDVYALYDKAKDSPFDFDVALGIYLIDPTTDVNNLSRFYALRRAKLNTFDLFLSQNKRIKTAIEEKGAEFNEAVANTMYILYDLYEDLSEEIDALEMTSLYFDVEMPLTLVLADMEKTGVLVDTKILNKLGEEFEKNLADIEKEIYELAGEEFNINSPKQLGEILFDKLDMPYIKKTKTGYSTDKETLGKLAEDFELPKLVLEYREIAKLKSTYVDGMEPLISKDGRLRTTFNQTVTATGRISSTEPNLQNIPVRTKRGKELRKVFVAKDDSYFYDLDYSQIELRLMAAISGETKMIEGFEGDLDIHRTTASEVFHKPYDEVTDLERSHAKATNFGIIYGISDYGLSRQLGIKRSDAKEYIDNYFERFPNIKKYMEEIVKDAKKQGYVKTLFNRRRMIPELKNSNYNIRSFGERIALNTPIQGSAADIIKIAMVKVWNYLNENNFNTKLILTIHDELIFEVPKYEYDEVKDEIKKIMTDSFNVGVKLKVDGNVADNWYDAK